MSASAGIKPVARDVRAIKEELVERIPHHFSMKAIVGAAFGALIFGLTFTLKGLLLEVTKALTPSHLLGMLVAIIVILSGGIYFVGYAHVKNPAARTFGQFWLKRITTYFVVGFAVS